MSDYYQSWYVRFPPCEKFSFTEYSPSYFPRHRPPHSFPIVENPPPSDQPLNPQDGAGAGNPDGDRYVISIKQVAKFVVGLGDRVSPTDVEEGMRVG